MPSETAMSRITEALPSLSQLHPAVQITLILAMGGLALIFIWKTL
jgi:hypothetical protein